MGKHLFTFLDQPRESVSWLTYLADEAALEMIVENMEGLIFNMYLRMLGRIEDAKEAPLHAIAVRQESNKTKTNWNC